jgi:hypothetical protein
MLFMKENILSRAIAPARRSNKNIPVSGRHRGTVSALTKSLDCGSRISVRATSIFGLAPCWRRLQYVVGQPFHVSTRQSTSFDNLVGHDILTPAGLSRSYPFPRPEKADMRSLQAYLGLRNIQSTVRYTAMAPDWFKGWEND